LEQLVSPVASPADSRPDPCARETVLSAISKSRKRAVEQQEEEEEDQAFGNDQESKRRPGSLKRSLVSHCPDDCSNKRSRTSSISSLNNTYTAGIPSSSHNVISSSYSSSCGLSQLRKRSGVSVSSLSSPASSRSQTPERPLKKAREEELHRSNTSTPAKSDKELQTEKAVETPVRKRRNSPSPQSTSQSSGTRRRKIQLLTPNLAEPLALPPPPQLGYSITAEDLDAEKKAAWQWINKFLEDKTGAQTPNSLASPAFTELGQTPSKPPSFPKPSILFGMLNTPPASQLATTTTAAVPTTTAAVPTATTAGPTTTPVFKPIFGALPKSESTAPCTAVVSASVTVPASSGPSSTKPAAGPVSFGPPFSFGAPAAQSAAQPAFGSGAQPAFGTASAQGSFGTSSTQAAFGTTTSIFSFGTATSTTAGFGSTTQTPTSSTGTAVFGTTPSPFTFGASAQPGPSASAFGIGTPALGSGSPAVAFSFGAGQSTAAPAAAPFGSSLTQSALGAQNQSTPFAFTVPSTPDNKPVFGGTPAPAFGQSTPVPGAVGSGSSSLSFGTPSTPASGFGGVGASFGSSTPAFSIGAGSKTGARQRLEARRQHSAPGKAASPRQGQEGKVFTSLWHGTRVSAEPRRTPHCIPPRLAHLKAAPCSCSTACTTSSFSSWCSEQVE
ncbi:PREDICTED: nuclear envelope pore membrane protein POM 121-like, partial [Tauraco erythrolophus]|uniref:nuclear envelope pore membrane protein POM 121-like n=1 Tax=Tauraco erythrolophus TaxID=121530 RepID=UPI000523DC16